MGADGGSAASEAAAWLCAEIPGSNLHLTLVPPPSAALGGGGGGGGAGGGGGGGRAADGPAAQRAAAVRRLRRFAGQHVRISLLRYHLLTTRVHLSPDGATAVAGGGGGGGRSGRGGLVLPDRQCGFWEVGGVIGLPEDAHFPLQQAIYHVTDTASLIGCAAREAGELLRALRRGDLSPEWEHVCTPPLPEDGAPREVLALVRIVH